jgi:hypothetical protein
MGICHCSLSNAKDLAEIERLEAQEILDEQYENQNQNENESENKDKQQILYEINKKNIEYWNIDGHPLIQYFQPFQRKHKQNLQEPTKQIEVIEEIKEKQISINLTMTLSTSFDECLQTAFQKHKVTKKKNI